MKLQDLLERLRKTDDREEAIRSSAMFGAKLIDDMTDSDNKDYAMSHIANLYGAATVAYVLGVMEDHKDCCAKGQNPMRILEEMMRKVDDKIVENLIENLKMRGIDLFKSHNEQLVDELLKQLEEENGNCKDPS